MGRKRNNRSRSRRKRRTRRKRRKSAMQRISVRKWPTSFPDSLITKQKFHTSFVYTAQSTASQVFALNNLNDVDATSSGDQFANMTAQLRTFYNRWKVYAAKVHIKCINISETEAVACTLNFQNSATPVSFRENMENVYNKYWVVGVEQGGHNIVSRTMYMSLKKLAGESLTGHSYDGSALADPSIIFHGIFQADSLGGGNMTLEVEVSITYYVRYYHRQLVPITPDSVLV